MAGNSPASEFGVAAASAVDVAGSRSPVCCTAPAARNLTEFVGNRPVAAAVSTGLRAVGERAHSGSSKLAGTLRTADDGGENSVCAMPREFERDSSPYDSSTDGSVCWRKMAGSSGTASVAEANSCESAPGVASDAPPRLADSSPPSIWPVRAAPISTGIQPDFHAKPAPNPTANTRQVRNGICPSRSMSVVHDKRREAGLTIPVTPPAGNHCQPIPAPGRGRVLAKFGRCGYAKLPPASRAVACQHPFSRQLDFIP